MSVVCAVVTAGVVILAGGAEPLHWSTRPDNRPGAAGSGATGSGRAHPQALGLDQVNGLPSHRGRRWRRTR